MPRQAKEDLAKILAQQAAQRVAADLRKKKFGHNWDALDSKGKESVMIDLCHVILDELHNSGMELLEKLILEDKECPVEN